MASETSSLELCGVEGWAVAVAEEELSKWRAERVALPQSRPLQALEDEWQNLPSALQELLLQSGIGPFNGFRRLSNYFEGDSAAELISVGMELTKPLVGTADFAVNLSKVFRFLADGRIWAGE